VTLDECAPTFAEAVAEHLHAQILSNLVFLEIGPSEWIDQGGQLTAPDRCWARRTGGEKFIENVVVDLVVVDLANAKAFRFST
jgi:hypothetical protein